MKTSRRMIALLELLLVFPATLFMAALFLRDIQPETFEPARSAKRVVDWFAARPHLGLDVWLIALPLAALGIGGATVLRSWRRDAELRKAALAVVGAVRAHTAAWLIAGATLTAGAVLAIVALHIITD